jgi:hypothetical protein
MTRLLEKAFEEASKLPEDDQERLPRCCLMTLHLRNVGQKHPPKSQDKLALLAKEALTECG